MTDIKSLFLSWENTLDDPILEDGVPTLILYLAKKIFNDYEPEPLEPFEIRLERWLNNVENETEKKIMLNLLARVFFAGRGEFESLYRTGETIIRRWLMDSVSISIDDQQWSEKCQKALSETWICPITDSLRINSFLKVNGLKGHDHRPHWRSLSKFAEIKKIQEYMNEQGIRQIVLLEDFVGSGTQVASTIKYCAEAFCNINIIFVPLIVCPDGDRLFKSLSSNLPNLTYVPALRLPETAFLRENVTPDEERQFALGRELIERHAAVLGNDRFGFSGTGALVALFSNCPDNSLSLFRLNNTSWKPLFPRIWRPE